MLTGRTVVAIVHQLYTAHDADRVAVLQGVRLVDLGSYDELVACGCGGEYAALWESWHKGRGEGVPLVATLPPGHSTSVSVGLGVCLVSTLLVEKFVKELSG